MLTNADRALAAQFAGAEPFEVAPVAAANDDTEPKSLWSQRRAGPAITQQRLMEVVSFEAGVFRWRTTSRKGKAGAIAGFFDDEGYVRLCIDYKGYLAHRLAWLYVHGVWPSKDIDHIDGNPSNNAIENLRDVDQTVNQQNQRKTVRKTKSGLLGVTPNYNRWVARIVVDGKKKSIGSFATKEEAHAAYLQAKRQFHPGNTLGTLPITGNEMAALQADRAVDAAKTDPAVEAARLHEATWHERQMALCMKESI